ncbi:MAG TPA: GDSL-type esterase/lipase family protein [Terriglobales bacterium]|nr:GDSL-type esterase/lipase family protein [Terriglobales bacterium]
MRRKLWTSIIAVAIVCTSLFAVSADKPKQNSSGDHWIATWATSQLLTPMVFRMPPNMPRPQTSEKTSTVPPPGTSSPDAKAERPHTPPPPRSGPMASNLPQKFEDETVRMLARTTVGGRRVRVELSNMLNAEPLQVGAAHIAIHKGGGEIVQGTDRMLTFGGSKSFTIPPGVLVVSDPVDLDLPALSEFAVSLYLPHDTGAPTNHMLGLHTAYIAKGDVTGSVSMPNASTMFAYVWLSGVDVVAPPDAYTVVALGDSITDGYGTTRDADRAWPFLLAKRLSANKRTRNIAVVNQGISGNQVLRDGAGLSALARIDRDVLSRPGVKWVILLEGINDINLWGRSDGPEALTAEQLIWGYRQIIDRCHLHNIKVIGATIMPQEGVPTYTERGEQVRQAVNQWIREKGNFDAVVDFDAITKDPKRPVRLKEEFNPGDHIHPNDAGNQAMADAFNLDWFRM